MSRLRAPAQTPAPGGDRPPFGLPWTSRGLPEPPQASLGSPGPGPPPHPRLPRPSLGLPRPSPTPNQGAPGKPWQAQAGPGEAQEGPSRSQSPPGAGVWVGAQNRNVSVFTHAGQQTKQTHKDTFGPNGGQSPPGAGFGVGDLNRKMSVFTHAGQRNKQNQKDDFNFMILKVCVSPRESAQKEQNHKVEVAFKEN